MINKKYDNKLIINNFLDKIKFFTDDSKMLYLCQKSIPITMVLYATLNINM